MMKEFYSTRMVLCELCTRTLSLLRWFEHGDADSSGSTLRTMGIVLLVFVVVGIIGVALLAYAGNVGDAISGATYPW